MLRGHNLLYFGPEKWDGLWRNRHQLMWRFSRYNKVLYVEPWIYLKKVRQQLRSETLGLSSLAHSLSKKRVTMVKENLYVYHSPFFAPISGRFPLDKITFRLWKLLLSLTLVKLGIQKPIIWLSRPQMVSLLNRFNARLTIYHVVDEYKGYSTYDAKKRDLLNTLEREMLARVDLVIVVSENLLKSKEPYNKHTYLVPNAVDYEAYSQALASNELPGDIALLPEPIIGYSGLISNRLKLDLFERMAMEHPEWSIVLIGAINEGWSNPQFDRLKGMQNVHFLGSKKIDHVPNYVKAFDVCIIPYGSNEQVQNLSPIKLYDFLATGKAIVTTDFPVARDFANVIRIADSNEEFIRSVEEALTEASHELSCQRRLIASQNTWKNRVEQLSEIIQTHLQRIS